MPAHVHPDDCPCDACDFTAKLPPEAARMVRDLIDRGKAVEGRCRNCGEPVGLRSRHCGECVQLAGFAPAPYRQFRTGIGYCTKCERVYALRDPSTEDGLCLACHSSDVRRRTEAHARRLGAG